MDQKEAPAEHLDTIETQHDELNDMDELKNKQPPLLMSKLDNLSVWQAVKTYKRVTLVCMLAAFSASLDGYQLTLNGSIVANVGFIAQFSNGGTKLDAKYVSAWGGLQSTGQFLGQASLQFITDRFGRKMALYVTCVFLFSSVIGESLAKAYWSWLIAKLLAGLGIGMIQATLPVYISEHSPTQLRGFLINAYTFWFALGQLIAPVVLDVMKKKDPTNFRTPIYTQFGMTGAILIISLWLPESPWWLVSKGRNEEAQKILERHNGHIEGYSSKEQTNIMAATIAAEEEVARAGQMEGPWAIFKGTNGWRLLIAGWPKLMQQFVGLAVFNNYSTYFFQLAGQKNSFQDTVILTCVQLIAVILCATTADGFGRRPLVLIGYSITVLAVLGLGIVGCFDYTTTSIGSLLLFFCCIAIFSTTGASAVGYAYLAEIPQQAMRARTTGFGLAFSNLFAIMFSFCVPLMLNAPGWGVKTGFFYAGIGFPTIIIGYFLIPEVAKRTPAEIDEMFEKKVPPRKFKGYVTDVQLNLEEREMAGQA